MIGVDTVVPVLPRFPLTTPKHEQVVAFVELNENEDDSPVRIVDGEKGSKFTTGGGTGQTSPSEGVITAPFRQV